MPIILWQCRRSTKNISSFTGKKTSTSLLVSLMFLPQEIHKDHKASTPLSLVARPHLGSFYWWQLRSGWCLPTKCLTTVLETLTLSVDLRFCAQPTLKNHVWYDTKKLIFWELCYTPSQWLSDWPWRKTRKLRMHAQHCKRGQNT